MGKYQFVSMALATRKYGICYAVVWGLPLVSMRFTDGKHGVYLSFGASILVVWSLQKGVMRKMTHRLPMI